jgi:hypothetical protein
MQVGHYTKYKNNDNSMSIYREGVFVAALEDTTASCDLVYKMATEISKVELELSRAYAIIEIFEKALKQISEDESNGHTLIIARQALSHLKGLT